jgi:LPXTG-motif cell wall-anchored protein
LFTFVRPVPVERAARRPVHRALAGGAAAAALTATALALAPGAQATAGTHGATATATVLRTGLDVALLHRAADVPLDVTLDDVRAPADASRTALSATLDGVNGGRPFALARADVATARATADRHGSQGYVHLVNAQVVLPGLQLTPLVKVAQVTSEAACDAGRHPRASSNVLGTITVLGRAVTLSAGGDTDVTVPGVGRVHLALSHTATTSRTAAATALDLTVSVNPLGLGIASIKGDVTLARATCAAPSGTGGSSTGGSTSGGADGGSSGGTTAGTSGGTSGGGGSNGGATTGGSSGGTGGGAGSSNGGAGTAGGSSAGGSAGGAGGVRTLTPTGHDLAETGAGSGTPYLVVGAAALLVAGGTAVFVARRRRTAQEG